MMAAWDLDAMPSDLRRLDVPMLLIAGSNDRTIAPEQADRVAALLPRGRVEQLAGLGHLAHEERPALVCERIVAFFEEASARA
jgi:magnesium chelatase accessory protein